MFTLLESILYDRLKRNFEIMHNLLSIVFTISIMLPTYSMAGDGEEMKVHTSNISSISSIQEHVLVSGKSHSGLWLGPDMIFTPGNVTKDFHLFFTVTDRKGGDSMQEHYHFTAPRLSLNFDSLSKWKKQWKKSQYPKALHSRKNDSGYRFVPSFNWKFHQQSKKSIGFGHLLRHKGKHLSKHLTHLAITYSIYNPASGAFAPWKSFRIKIDGKKRPCVAYGQRVDLPNGDILLPFSTIKELKGWNSIRWCGSARCRFDGGKINVVDVSNLVTNSVPRGFVEPSMAEYNGVYYMTLRAQDGHAYYTTSKDGLTWEDPMPWSWDNGDTIPMDQTMTKFISRPDGLFLVYTRITENNKEVFRHRAPLFIAKIDIDNKCLVKETESTVLANNGFPLGNFNIHAISPKEIWITSQEWDRTGKNVDCDNLLGRIIWK